MRYALRNKQKIKEALGEDILSRIISSLDDHFKKNPDKLETEDMDNEPYPILLINDSGHSFIMIAFYVIDSKYDVCKLAFKEFIG